MKKYKCGSDAPQAKLTDDDVRLLREIDIERQELKRRLAPMSLSALAEKFDVSKATIKQVLAGETWRHLL